MYVRLLCFDYNSNTCLLSTINSNLCLYKIGEHDIIKTTLTRRGAFYHGKNIKAAAGYPGFY